MKKIIISLVLLGAVSLGSLAVVQNRGDEPPVRRTEARHCSHRHCDYNDCERGSGCRAARCRGYRDCDYRHKRARRNVVRGCGGCRNEYRNARVHRQDDRHYRHHESWHDSYGNDDVYFRR